MANKGSIIAVDDTPESLSMLVEILRGEGYLVRPADSGALALAAAFSKTPELILLDVRMPGMGGFEVMRRLRGDDRTRNVPVIFLSALTETADRVEGIRLGAVDFISKPFEREELLARIGLHLEFARLRYRLEDLVAQRTRELHVGLERLELATKAGNFGVWDWDVVDNVLLWDDSMYRVYGVRREDFGGAYETWSQCLYPEDKEYAEGEIQAALRGEREYAPEFRITRPDGTIRYIQAASRTFRDASGKPLRMIGTNIDITERKRAEAEIRHLKNYLSNIIDSMPSMLIGVDTAGVVTQWNAEAEKSLGIGPRDAVGRPLAEVFPHFAGEVQRITQSIARRTAVRDAKVAMRFSGQTRYSDVTIYPLIANGVQGAVIRVDDVTERVRMEEMMIQTEKMMSVGGLAAGMAHEINNPLAGIMQNLQVLEMYLTQDTPKNRRLAEECGLSYEGLQKLYARREVPAIIASVLASGKRAARIVGNMLSFSRKSDRGFMENDIAELIDTTVELAANDYDLKKKFDFRRIEIVREYEPVPKVPCEANQIQQVLLNILKNGAQAMASRAETDKERTNRFVLRVKRLEDAVRIEIEDNGPGMDEATRKRVFEPFFTTKEVGVGTGLGMSVSYFIITENHGGTIDVASKPGKGATFIVTLPVRRGGA